MPHPPRRALAPWPLGLLALTLAACASGGGDDGGAPPRPDAGPAECAEGETRCGGECVALSTSASHCGACGLACSDGEVCASGSCETSCPSGQAPCTVLGRTTCVSTTSDPANCGACGNQCEAGRACTGGACAEECGPGLNPCSAPGGQTSCASFDDDEAHCGACNTACVPGATCVSGMCRVVCEAGMEACGGLCLDLMTDPMNCGACAEECQPDEDCVSGACTPVCDSSEALCDGACRAIQDDSDHCGECGRRCPSGQACMAGECSTLCSPGQRLCGDTCVFVDRDPQHCGTCGNVCPPPTGGTAGCASASCTTSCPSGQTECSGTCRDLQTDGLSCGACGRACPSGTVCRAGGCVPELPPLGGPTFRVDSLSGTGCSTVNHEPTSGDDRGGIAVSSSQVFVSGDDATTRLPRSTFSAQTALNAHRDAMFTNVRNGALFALANDGGLLPRGGGTVTRFLSLSSATGQVSSTGHVSLSRPISLTSGNLDSEVGIFSGYDRVVFYNGSRVYSVALDTGVVTDMGPMPRPSRNGCENWAYWGIAETEGSATNLIFADSVDTVARVAAPSGAVRTRWLFDDLSDMCSITAHVPDARWYFHHEFTSEFTSTSGEWVGHCDLIVDTTNGFTLNFTRGACELREHAVETGDDRGGIAAGATRLFYSGDTATVGWSRTARPIPAGQRVGEIHDALVSNLRTGDVYTLANSNAPLARGGGVVTHLLRLSATSGSPTTVLIPLSAPITVEPGYFGSEAGIFSGYDRAVLHTGSRAYHISLPDGLVTDLGEMPRPSNRQGCESWAYWGVAEFFDGQLFLAYATNDDRIARARVPDGVTETIASFANASDLCSFTVAPALNQWFFHHENDSQFGGARLEETVGSCAASWSSP